MIKANLKVLNNKIQISDDNIEMLTQIAWDTDLSSSNPIDRLNSKISLFYDNYIQTKGEVVGRLTYSEALFLVLTIADMGYKIADNNKKKLVRSLCDYNEKYGKELIEDGKLICIKDKEQQEFSFDSIIEKIENMTQFQCFVIASLAHEVLTIMNRGNIVNFVSDRATKIICETFGIE